MENRETNIVFIDRISSNEECSLSDLVKEACQNKIVFFEYSIGSYVKQWKGAKRGSKLMYSIDNVNLCCCEIEYIKQRAFRPRWIPDHDNYKTFISFAKSFCSGSFNEEWKKEAIELHMDAIDKKRWFFVVLAIVEPMYYYTSNKEILDEKIREMAEAERDLERMVSESFSHV